jgi:hypothetical protein
VSHVVRAPLTTVRSSRRASSSSSPIRSSRASSTSTRSASCTATSRRTTSSATTKGGARSRTLVHQSVAVSPLPFLRRESSSPTPPQMISTTTTPTCRCRGRSSGWRLKVSTAGCHQSIVLIHLVSSYPKLHPRTRILCQSRHLESWLHLPRDVCRPSSVERRRSPWCHVQGESNGDDAGRE